MWIRNSSLLFVSSRGGENEYKQPRESQIVFVLYFLVRFCMECIIVCLPGSQDAIAIAE